MGTDAKATARRYYEEVLNQGRLEVLDEIATGNYQENAPLPGQGTGREGLKRRAATFRSTLAQHFTVEQVICEGDLVAVRWSARGTHVGEFFGIPPTGRAFTMSGIDIHRMEDGRLAEHWHEVDALGLMQQLGAIPSPA